MKLFGKLALTGAGVLAAARMLKPRTDKFSKVRRLTQGTFSYKGMFDNCHTPENSIPAFTKALEKGLGIFTNLILTSDNQPVLIHKESIAKMLNTEVDIESLSLEEVRAYRLSNTELKIPTLAELFELVGGRVPIYIRVEPHRKHSSSTVLGAIGREFDSYDGDVIFDTADENLLHSRVFNRPDMIFGKALLGRTRNGSSTILRDFLRNNLLTNLTTAPDFISCRYSCRSALGLNLCRNIYAIPVFYWPIRSSEQYDNAVDDGAGVIACNYYNNKY